MTNGQNPRYSQYSTSKAEKPKTRTPSGKPYDIRERSFEFAKRIYRITRLIPPGSANEVLARQLIAAGTSIGANIEEADGADSKKDQRKHLVISRKECRECRYWLRLLSVEVPEVGDLSSDVDESTQLIRILSALVARL